MIVSPQCGTGPSPAPSGHGIAACARAARRVELASCESRRGEWYDSRERETL